MSEMFSTFYPTFCSTLHSCSVHHCQEGMSPNNDAWMETDVAEIMALIGLFHHLGPKKRNLVSVDKI